MPDKARGHVPVQRAKSVLQPWRDAGSIRDASPAVQQRTRSQRVFPVHMVFLFLANRQRARKNPRPCRPQSRRLSELSVFCRCSRVAYFFSSSCILYFHRCRYYARCFARDGPLPLFSVAFPVTPRYKSLENNLRIEKKIVESVE